MQKDAEPSSQLSPSLAFVTSLSLVPSCELAGVVCPSSLAVFYPFALFMLIYLFPPPVSVLPGGSGVLAAALMGAVFGGGSLALGGALVWSLCPSSPQPLSHLGSSFSPCFSSSLL